MPTSESESTDGDVVIGAPGESSTPELKHFINDGGGESTAQNPEIASIGKIEETQTKLRSEIDEEKEEKKMDR